MDLYEANAHSFVVKIWLEETAMEAGRAIWRGHITHVPSGERLYIKELDEVTQFILPYLKGLGADTPG
jgi:hypothetical protein